MTDLKVSSLQVSNRSLNWHRTWNPNDQVLWFSKKKKSSGDFWSNQDLIWNLLGSFFGNANPFYFWDTERDGKSAKGPRFPDDQASTVYVVVCKKKYCKDCLSLASSLLITKGHRLIARYLSELCLLPYITRVWISQVTNPFLQFGYTQHHISVYYFVRTRNYSATLVSGSVTLALRCSPYYPTLYYFPFTINSGPGSQIMIEVCF